MTKQQPLMPTTEIMGAIMLPNLSGDDIKNLREDTHNFFASNLNYNLTEGSEVHVLENTDSTIHLALPYYEFLTTSSSAELGDGDLEAVAGGEIFITIGVLIGGAIGFAAAGATSGGLAAVGAVAIGVGVGAAAGAAATGGMIHGAIQNNKKKSKKTGINRK